MSTNTNKRKRIFEKYSKNWEHYSQYLKLPRSWVDLHLYICPMCLGAFDETGLDQSREMRLTLEDVPPKSLGGRPVILTCNTCNSKSGSELDVHLLNQTKALNLLSRKEGVSKEVLIHVDKNVRVKGDMFNISNETLGFRINRKSNPRVQEGIENLFKGLSGRLTIKLQGGNPNRIELAKLRIAYLLAFERFGYGFILNKAFEEVRIQLLNPEKSVFPIMVLLN